MIEITYKQAGVPEHMVSFNHVWNLINPATRVFPENNENLTFLLLILRFLKAKTVGNCSNKFKGKLFDLQVTEEPINGNFDVVLVNTAGQMTKCEGKWFIVLLEESSMVEHSICLLPTEIPIQIYDLPGPSPRPAFLLYSSVPKIIFPPHPAKQQYYSNDRINMRSVLAMSELVCEHESIANELKMDVHTTEAAFFLADWEAWKELCGVNASNYLTEIYLSRYIVQVALFERFFEEDLLSASQKALPRLFPEIRNQFVSTPHLRPKFLQQQFRHGPTHVQVTKEYVLLSHSLPRTGTDPTIRDVIMDYIRLPADHEFLVRFMNNYQKSNILWLEFDINVDIPGVQVYAINPLARRRIGSKVPRGHIVIGAVSSPKLWKEITQYASSVYQCSFTVLQITPGQLALIEGDKEAQAALEASLSRA